VYTAKVRNNPRPWFAPVPGAACPARGVPARVTLGLLCARRCLPAAGAAPVRYRPTPPAAAWLLLNRTFFSKIRLTSIQNLFSRAAMQKQLQT